MGHRLSKIYTKTGDDGSTAVSDGKRIGKDHLRIQAIGEVDELNSFIGVILSHRPSPQITTLMTQIQHQLFDLGGELSLPSHVAIKVESVDQLEKLLDQYNATLNPLKEFILPGGSPLASFCHYARTICRRAERQVVALNHEEPVSTNILAYLNRLSDLLFVIARVINHQQGQSDVLWQPQH